MNFLAEEKEDSFEETMLTRSQLISGRVRYKKKGLRNRRLDAMSPYFGLADFYSRIVICKSLGGNCMSLKYAFYCGEMAWSGN